MVTSLFEVPKKCIDEITWNMIYFIRKDFTKYVGFMLFFKICF